MCGAIVSNLHTVSWDERYIAKEHMDVRCDCVGYARRISINMGATAAQYLSSGHALKHPCAFILDAPFS